MESPALPTSMHLAENVGNPPFLTFRLAQPIPPSRFRNPFVQWGFVFINELV
jgi:hypothetical protein